MWGKKFGFWDGKVVIMGRFIKDEAVVTVILGAEETEKFCTAFYGITRMIQEGVINLPEWMERGVGVVYDKITNYINEHNLGAGEGG
jgi:hypothetical protein